VTGTANDGWENSSGSIVSGESSFAHAGAIVNDQGSYFIVTHFENFVLSRCVVHR
jgi:hypothetical protein